MCRLEQVPWRPPLISQFLILRRWPGLDRTGASRVSLYLCSSPSGQIMADGGSPSPTVPRGNMAYCSPQTGLPPIQSLGGCGQYKAGPSGQHLLLILYLGCVLFVTGGNWTGDVSKRAASYAQLLSTLSPSSSLSTTVLYVGAEEGKLGLTLPGSLGSRMPGG